MRKYNMNLILNLLQRFRHLNLCTLDMYQLKIRIAAKFKLLFSIYQPNPKVENILCSPAESLLYR